MYNKSFLIGGIFIFLYGLKMHRNGIKMNPRHFSRKAAIRSNTSILWKIYRIFDLRSDKKDYHFKFNDIDFCNETLWNDLSNFQLDDDNISGDIINKFTRYYTSIGHISNTLDENIESDI